ncbi:MAG: 50S ribosomal protein L9 [Planctomycetaceae bacterium]|nr:50S ribosomal protein L9 [Planctomycetaceae bacterium]MCP4461312.1 50S ribosomal protein L9 [Planctomycetaceae bacterium]MDG1809328.1 50S ribosomal protein L9 [Pirellulaceae bacterium]MDG2104399.1 50S ribosomal protein L9 [Pirellulaceae bacterium]
MKTQKQKKQRRAPKGFKRLPTGANGGIELLLIQSVEHLGNHGDVVEVKAGYAHNFLIPQGLATVATDHHKRMVDKHKEKLAEIAKLKLKQFEGEASELEKLSLTIEANANEEGHLYGSVGAMEIVKALKQSNVSVSQEQIKLDGVLKELGLYTVKVRLHQDVEADLKVWVVPSVENEDA